MPDKLLTTRARRSITARSAPRSTRWSRTASCPRLRVGGQWRFSAEAIDTWLKTQHGKPPAEPPRREAAADLTSLRLADLVSIDTLQSIQDQFAQLLGVAAFITDLDGQPFVLCSRCSRFCQLVTRPSRGWPVASSRGAPWPAWTKRALTSTPVTPASATPARRWSLTAGVWDGHRRPISHRGACPGGVP